MDRVLTHALIVRKEPSTHWAATNYSGPQARFTSGLHVVCVAERLLQPVILHPPDSAKISSNCRKMNIQMS